MSILFTRCLYLRAEWEDKGGNDYDDYDDEDDDDDYQIKLKIYYKNFFVKVSYLRSI